MESRNIELPDCWLDDSRMNVLFAPFRPKSINPTDWESKMKFWEGIIKNYCQANRRAIIDAVKIKNACERKGQKPACLETVFNHLVGKGILVTSDTFKKKTEPSWSKWAANVFLLGPMQWTLNKVGSAVISDASPANTPFIHLPTIEFLSFNLVESIPSNMRGKLLHFDEVLKLSGLAGAEDLSLILQWLKCRQQVAVTREVPPVELIKFARLGDKTVTITEVDKGIYKLDQQIQQLQKLVETLEKRKEDVLTEARKHVRAKSQSMAKHCLRKKHQLEKLIEKRLVALENIENLLDKIHQAETDSAVLECYKSGIAALQTSFKLNSLTEDNVTETMDTLEDTLDIHKDIEETLSRPVGSQDDTTLEDELNQLLAEEADVPTDSSSGGQSQPVLPDVPQHSATQPTPSLDSLEKRLESLSF